MLGLDVRFVLKNNTCFLAATLTNFKTAASLFVAINKTMYYIFHLFLSAYQFCHYAQVR